MSYKHSLLRWIACTTVRASNPWFLFQMVARQANYAFEALNYYSITSKLYFLSVKFCKSSKMQYFCAKLMWLLLIFHVCATYNDEPSNVRTMIKPNTGIQFPGIIFNIIISDGEPDLVRILSPDPVEFAFFTRAKIT